MSKGYWNQQRVNLLEEYDGMTEQQKSKLLTFARNMRGMETRDQVFAILSDLYVGNGGLPVQITATAISELMGLSKQRVCKALYDLIERGKLQKLAHEHDNLSYWRPIIRVKAKKDKSA